MKQKKGSTTRKAGEVIRFTTPEGRWIEIHFHRVGDDIEIEMDMDPSIQVQSMTEKQAIWLSDKAHRRGKKEDVN